MPDYVDQLTFRSFRGSSCQNADLFPLTILAGRNNSGKTTFLEAFALSLAPSEVLPWVFRHRGIVDIVREANQTFGTDCIFQTREKMSGTTRTLHVRERVPTVQDSTSSKYRDFDPATWLSFSGDMTASVGIDKLGKIYVIHNHGAPKERVVGLVDASRSDVAELNQALSAAQEAGSSAMADLVSFVSAWDPRIRDIRAFFRADSWSFEVLYEDRSVPIHFLGDGARRALQIAAELARAEVVIIDEPEVCQHPTIVPNVCTMIFESVKKGRQVVVATHSPDVVRGFAATVASMPLAEAESHIGLVELRRSSSDTVDTCSLPGCQAPNIALRLKELF